MKGCHPVISAIPNWEKKVAMPPPWLARMRRAAIKHRASLPNYLPSAIPAATTYGLPVYNAKTGWHEKAPERNEFWDNPKLLSFLCCDGKCREPWPEFVKRP